MSCEVVILAAGKGSRMFSDKVKVLHELAGQSMLSHQLDMLSGLDECSKIHLVIGHGHDQIIKELAKRKDKDKINLIEQGQQLGTGHAAAQALPQVSEDSLVLILAGDIPLISANCVQSLWQAAEGQKLALLQAELKQPYGYGRLLRDAAGNISGIVEEKDANAEQKKIRQVYCGVLAARASLLSRWLKRIDNKNAQSEYYLTDAVSLAVADGVPPVAVPAASTFDYFGINSHNQLAYLERLWQEQQADELMARGVSICDPKRFDLRGSLQHGRDLSIDINAVLVGDISLADSVTIGANCYLENCQIGSGSHIAPFTHISNARIGRNCSIGPYARIRPGSVLADSVRIGNFVELKKTHLEQGAKVNHLSYLGDTDVGNDSNIGAGTITCNYDGSNKHKTSIGKEVFVGSNSSLVAPITIGDGATIGAGSVINKNVGEKSLAISRSKQKQYNGWDKK